MSSRLLIKLCIILPLFSIDAGALSVTDDGGQVIELKREARRIVTLAPHIVEQLFAIGAGDRIVGTVSYSDYPEAANDIPLIGAYNRFDMEAIIALKPDLVIGWLSGNSAGQVAQLKALGIPLFLDEPRKIEDIPNSLERLGAIVGQQQRAAAVAQKFRAEFRALGEKFSSKTRVTLFYQLWHQPLMTVNGDQIINDIIDHCGGENIFKDLAALTPVVSREAVIAADPQVIITSGMKDAWSESGNGWLQWDSMRAVGSRQIYAIDPDIIHRASPRMLRGAEMICRFIDAARQLESIE